MPSARELLEQADALMRKNRTRGDGDIPLLTEAVALLPVAVELPMSAPVLVAAHAAPVALPAAVVHAAANVVPVPAPPSAHSARSAPREDDVPVLTDAVEDVMMDFALPEEPRAALVAIMEGDPSDWLVMDTIDPASHSITGRAPDTLAAVPPMTLKAAGSEATPPPKGSQPRAQSTAPVETDWLSLPVATAYRQQEPRTPEARVEDAEREAPEPKPQAAIHLPAESESDAALGEPKYEPPHESAAALEPPVRDGPSDEEHWRALAEQISMQVLQRLDLFTDSGLKEQLAQRLRPIVDRASAELVGELTGHVGRLIRTYVSEAIEREIAQWKREQH